MGLSSLGGLLCGSRRVIDVRSGDSLSHLDASLALAHIAGNMRAEDVREVYVTSRMSPLDALQFSWWASSHGWIVYDRGGEPIVAFGAAPHIVPQAGIAWLLGTDGIRREALSIARQTPRYVEEMQAAYAFLWNHVDVRNVTSIRWLKHAGFQIASTGPHGVEGEPFHLFTRITHV